MSANTAGPAAQTVLATYPTYEEAQRAVDFLSDQRFPVQHVTIIGNGLRLVERVAGRLSYGRAALMGAASGAWIGLLVGLFVAIFSEGTTAIWIILWGLLWGVIAGVLLAVIFYAFTGGERDFISSKALRADSYDVTVDSDQAEAARAVLARLHT